MQKSHITGQFSVHIVLSMASWGLHGNVVHFLGLDVAHAQKNPDKIRNPLLAAVCQPEVKEVIQSTLVYKQVHVIDKDVK